MSQRAAQEQAKIDALVSVSPMPAALEYVCRATWATNVGAGIRGMGRENFKAWFGSVLDRTLERATLYAILDRQSPDYLYGWICFEWLSDDLPVIHYCYVKHDWRRNGLLSRLAMAAGVTRETDLVYTFKTPAGRHQIKAHRGAAEYIPIETYLKDYRR